MAGAGITGAGMGDALDAAGGVRTFCDAAARALAQLARLGASSFGAGSDFVAAVAGNLPAAGAGFAISHFPAG